jgi:hypothetical protein
MKADLNAAEFEMIHWGDPLNALNHAGCHRRKKQLRWIESIGTTVDIGIKNDFCILAACRAAMGVNALRDNVVFEHCTVLF